MYNESTVSMRIRQLIFLVVLSLSLVGLATILVYSTGYRLDLENWRLQPTGSIRIGVEPKDDVLILLLPVGASRNSNQASFTHLLPGTYHLYVEASGYESANFELEVQPNSTLIIEPLRLWPTKQPKQLLVDPVQPDDAQITDLSIALQSAIAQLGISSTEVKVLSINQHTVVVLNLANGSVQAITQTNNIVQTRNLGLAKDIQLASNSNEILLVGQFDLQRVNIETGVTETITRLSKAISSVAWITGTPYVAYGIDQSIHIIDTRSFTRYHDQMVATTNSTVSDLRYDTPTDTLYFNSGDLAYAFPLRASK